MSKILDPLGLPAGNNNRPQQQGQQINPVLALLWPVYCQSLSDLLTTPRQPGVGRDPTTPNNAVETAWEIANRTFRLFGFEYVYPMGCRVIQTPEVSETQKEGE